MYTLVAFATHWGSRQGGINAFNWDFLSAFGFAYSQKAQVICIVSSADAEELENAHNVNVRLIALPFAPKTAGFDREHGEFAINELKRLGVEYEPENTIWLGHDRITGEAAIAARRSGGGQAAVIHHMSYADYEPYAEDSRSAQPKIQAQTRLLQSADIVMAVGPLLRDAANDRIGGTKSVHMLVPGLAEITSKDAPNTFTAFMSGRLADNAARIKQGQLGIAAFATAWREARKDHRPEALRKRPKLVLRGVDFEGQLSGSSFSAQHDPEVDLKEFAQEYADAAVNLHALPYIFDRQELYSELSASSVALMPSWHEGFGLVAWEAIAAGVPLIVSEQSGVYRLLEEEYPGAGTGCVFRVDVAGAEAEPFFTDEDLTTMVEKLKEVADNPLRARKQASILRNMLSDYTWAACAEQATNSFGWELDKGSLPVSREIVSEISQPPVIAAPPADESSLLRLPIGQWRAGTGMADSQLLRAEEARLPFDAAREPDIENLTKWLDDTSFPQSVRLITGAGGQGKTRLALELCHRRKALGWRVGFLDSAVAASQITGKWNPLREFQQSFLIVIDYAETRQSQLLELIKAITQYPTSQSVRILLLARDGGEWWDNLPSKDPKCEALLSGYATTGPFRLRPLYGEEPNRRAAFKIALETFATTLGVSAPEIDPDLHGEHFERPLYLQMAALLALYGERPITAEGLTKALLNHERRYWKRLLEHFNWPEPERRAEQLLALATLAGGFALPRYARDLWNAAGLADISSGEFNTLFRELATLYPGTQALEALRPDLLGEGLVAQAALRLQGGAILDAVLSSSASQIIRRNAMTILARLSTHRFDLHETIIEALARHSGQLWKELVSVSTETLSHLPDLAEQSFRRLSSTHKSQVAGLLAPVLEEESVQFAALGCLVFEYLTEKSRVKFEKRPKDIVRAYEYGEALSAYAVQLSYNGRYERAREIGFAALEISRTLVKRDRSRFEPFYARTLNNYAGYLYYLKQEQEILELADEALQIRKALAKKNPERFEPEYVSSLRNYATRLGDAGRTEDALKNAEEALEISERLVQRDPERFEDDYALALSNRSIHLSDLGRDEEALQCSLKALEIRERLAKGKPDRFEPYYAITLSDHASTLSDFGLDEEALEYAGRALGIRRRLAQKNPERFEPLYARSLSSYASYLWDLDRTREALEHARESLKLRGQLMKKNFERFGSDYASSLSNLAGLLIREGEIEPALKHAREALEICEQLKSMDANRFEPDYAWQLQNYATHSADAGKHEQAVDHARQAFEIYQKLTKQEPDRFMNNYSKSLSSFANHLSDLGRYDTAVMYAREGLKIDSDLAAKNKRYIEDLFVTGCQVRFLAWLCTSEKSAGDLMHQAPMTGIPHHRRGLMRIFSSFIDGCQTTDQVGRTESFRQVLEEWKQLSIRQERQAEREWFCVVAWSSTFDAASVKNVEWEKRWQHYAKQRSGQVPKWMLEVACRLGFSWPNTG